MSDELSEDFAPDALEAAGALRQYPDPGYIWPSDPRTLAALEKWRDHKVGVIIHWGIFSHWTGWFVVTAPPAFGWLHRSA